MNEALLAAARALDAADSVVVLGHVGPDGDALGSMLALATAARAAGKEAWATFGEPFVLGRQFRYLETGVLTSPGKVRQDVDVAVVVDTGVRSRLGSALGIVESAGKVVIIDHHSSRDNGFGDIHVIDTTAAAAAQIVFRLIRELDWPLTEEVATDLYTGVVTDTGRFQYEATSPEVHRITAELLEAGVRPTVVGRHVYEESPFGYLQVAGAVLSRAQLDEEHRLVWSVLLRADLTAAGLRYEDADGLIDLIRVAEESEVACLLREIGDGKFKGSLRSRGMVDVAVVAARFGGGGHHNAAGFVAEGSADDVIAAVGKALS